jgi:hypothetical protein
LSCGRRFRPGASVPIESELARHVAGHVPLLTLSCLRWIGSFLILLPFASPHLKRDWIGADRLAGVVIASRRTSAKA